MALELDTLFSEQEILAFLKAAYKDKFVGSSMISSGSGDVQAARQIQARADRRIIDLKSYLFKHWPDTYPQFSTVGHNQTVASFASSSATTSDE